MHIKSCVPLLPVLLCFFFLPVNSNAGNDNERSGEDQEISVRYLKGKDAEEGRTAKWQQIDTSLHNFQHYDIYRDAKFPALNTGSPGLPVFGLTFSPESRPVHFRHGFNQAEPYRFNFENTQFYDTYTPYSNVRYLIGQENFQFASATHSRNILANWNIGFDIDRRRSDGFYFNQNSLHTQGRLHTRYQSLDRRYKLYFSGSWNRINFQENGGLLDERAFEQAPDGDKIRSQVNLDEAFTSWDDKNFTLLQRFALGKTRTDTVYSEDTSWVTNLYPSWEIFVRSDVEFYQMDYEDPAPPEHFYPDYREDRDPPPVFDSITGRRLYNEAGLHSGSYELFSGDRESPDSRNWYVKGSFKHWNDNYRQNQYTTSFNNLGFTAGVGWRPGPVKTTLNAEYVFDGPLTDNFSAEADFRVRLTDQLNVTAKGIHSRLLPQFNVLYFRSPLYYWTNDFQQEITSSAMLELDRNENLTIGAAGHQIGHYVYHDAMKRPAQYHTPFNVLHLYLSGGLNYLGFHLQGQAGYQHSEEDVVRIPEFYGKGSFFYERELFDQALTARLGVDGMIFSEYNANLYMPYTGAMHHPGTNRLTGNYPFMDVFLTARIKQVRIFAKYEHVNANLMGDRYYQTRGYPRHPAAFRLGIEWMFFD